MKLFFISLISLITISSFASPSRSSLTVNEAIDKTSQQRMLAQRIAKASVAAFFNVSENEKEQVTTCTGLFDTNLKELKDYTATAAYTKKIEYTAKLWSSFKFMLDEDDLSKESLLQLLEMSDKIMESCDAVIAELLIYAPTAASELKEKTYSLEMSNVINLSGRQCMLTQKLAVHYLASVYSLDLKSENGEELLTKTTKEFKKGLKDLLVFDKNTKGIDGKLAELISAWREVEALSKSVATADKDDKAFINDFLNKVDKLWMSMDDLSALYENLAELGTPSERGAANFMNLYNNAGEGN